MYMSHADAVIARIRQGIDAGLVAAAENVTTKIRTRLDRGYTTGAFAHHARGVAGRVMYTQPTDVPGGRAITIGTSTVAGFPYELAWELGHVNLFTRRYERVEVWRPMLEQNRDLMVRIVARNIERYAGGASFTLSFGAP